MILNIYQYFQIVVHLPESIYSSKLEDCLYVKNKTQIKEYRQIRKIPYHITVEPMNPLLPLAFFWGNLVWLIILTIRWVCFHLFIYLFVFIYSIVMIQQISLTASSQRAFEQQQQLVWQSSVSRRLPTPPIRICPDPFSQTCSLHRFQCVPVSPGCPHHSTCRINQCRTFCYLPSLL